VSSGAACSGKTTLLPYDSLLRGALSPSNLHLTQNPPLLAQDELQPS
jgi:hypothetical protein